MSKVKSYKNLNELNENNQFLILIESEKNKIDMLLDKIDKDKIKHIVIAQQARFILAREIMFGLFQCAKILFHYNYNNITDFVMHTPIHSSTEISSFTNNFRQTSCILSYYFIKTALLLNNNSLFKFLNSNLLSSINPKINVSDSEKNDYKKHN